MGYYKTACICLNGHLVAGDSRSEDAAPKCPDCGATTISQCPDCSTDIRGTFDSDFGYYSPPPVKPYCRQCGAPYPWTKSRIDGVMELADAIDELTDYERDSLRDLLPHIIEETPRTPAAGFKVIAIIGHLAGPAKTLLREAVFSIAADVAKKAMGMG